jgi:inhibitor of KinA
MNDFPRIQPIGDSAAVIELGAGIALETNRRVSALAAQLTLRSITGVIEVVPTYAAVTVYYDPMQATYDEIASWLRLNAAQAAAQGERTAHVIEIPTLYGGEYGPDLTDVAAYHGLTPESVIAVHTGRDYHVFMLGFTPGFPYLGELDPRIVTPRLDSPRQRVPMGSVGIAANQTGIYPIQSPGGWRIIGRTTLKLFDLHRDPPFLIDVGDTVRFVRCE